MEKILFKHRDRGCGVGNSRWRRTVFKLTRVKNYIPLLNLKEIKENVITLKDLHIEKWHL